MEFGILLSKGGISPSSDYNHRRNLSVRVSVCVLIKAKFGVAGVTQRRQCGALERWLWSTLTCVMMWLSHETRDGSARGRRQVPQEPLVRQCVSHYFRGYYSGQQPEKVCAISHTWVLGCHIYIAWRSTQGSSKTHLVILEYFYGHRFYTILLNHWICTFIASSVCGCETKLWIILLFYHVL